MEVGFKDIIEEIVDCPLRQQQILQLLDLSPGSVSILVEHQDIFVGGLIEEPEAVFGGIVS